MNNADVQEMLAIAILAKESGFPRIQADPADIIEVFDQRNQLLEALQLITEHVNRYIYGDEDVIVSTCREALNRAKGESK